MKPSPLQLEWLIYPAASFRALAAEKPDRIQSVRVTAEVAYHLDRPHSVEISLSSDDSSQDAAYTFAIEAVAAFRFDLALAQAAYRNTQAQAMPRMIAVNVARIVYSAARELLATFTARAPHGSVLVESVLIGPEDVKIVSVESQGKMLQELFGVEPSEALSKKASPRRKI